MRIIILIFLIVVFGCGNGFGGMLELRKKSRDKQISVLGSSEKGARLRMHESGATSRNQLRPIVPPVAGELVVLMTEIFHLINWELPILNCENGDGDHPHGVLRDCKPHS